MDKERLKSLVNEFLNDHIKMFKEAITGDEWVKERKSIYKLYRDKFSPHRLNQLTTVDFAYFLTFKGNKSWTNLQRSCKKLTHEMRKLREILGYLQNESIPVEKRLNDVTAGGKLYSKGFGKNISTGLLHVFDWQKYGVWNNRSEKVLSRLGKLPHIAYSNFGQSYLRINSELKRIAKELNTDLVYLDGFLWWLDDSGKIEACLIKKKHSKVYHRKFANPSINNLKNAGKAFEENEPRDLFYRTAKELVDLAIRKETVLTVAEALAVLLQTWNREYYRYREFDSAHFSDIKNIINTHFSILLDLRQRSLEDFSDKDEALIKKIFTSFEKILGPVGTAKSLHLLAPYFFPLWDRAIAAAYRVTLLQSGKNADNYCTFMKITKDQCIELGGEKILGRNPLKALDEYNYCKFTKKWI